MRVTIFKYGIYFLIRIINALFIKKYVFLGNSEKYIKNGGCIAPSWHQNILLYFGIKFHKGGGLASKSRDGDYMLKIADANGWRAFRGSSSKGGAEAMDQVINHFKNVESDMTFLVRLMGEGAWIEVKRGIFHIAKETGKPIVPVVPVQKKYKTVKSWDQHKIPYPFQTCFYVFGDPIYVDSEETDLVLKNIEEDFDQKMQELSNWSPKA